MNVQRFLQGFGVYGLGRAGTRGKLDWSFKSDTSLRAGLDREWYIVVIRYNRRAIQCAERIRLEILQASTYKHPVGPLQNPNVHLVYLFCIGSSTAGNMSGFYTKHCFLPKTQHIPMYPAHHHRNLMNKYIDQQPPHPESCALAVLGIKRMFRGWGLGLGLKALQV